MLSWARRRVSRAAGATPGEGDVVDSSIPGDDDSPDVPMVLNDDDPVGAPAIPHDDNPAILDAVAYAPVTSGDGSPAVPGDSADPRR